MSCYCREEGVDYSSSGGTYPDIPDFSHLKVNESNTPVKNMRDQLL